jgi:hypothetical protein
MSCSPIGALSFQSRNCSTWTKVKGKGKFVPMRNYVIKHHAVNTYGGEWRYSSTILDLCTRWRWSASRPGPFAPGDRAPGTHWVGGLVGSRVDLDAMENRKNLLPLPVIEPRSFSPQTSWYTDWAILAPIWAKGHSKSLTLSTAHQFPWLLLLSLFIPEVLSGEMFAVLLSPPY